MTTISPEMMLPPQDGIDVIETVLNDHKAVTISFGDDQHGWACKCGARPAKDEPRTDHATAWRAARHHTAEQITRTLADALIGARR